MACMDTNSFQRPQSLLTNMLMQSQSRSAGPRQGPSPPAACSSPLLRRVEVQHFMHELGIPSDETLLAPATAADVFVRMCHNLLHLYRILGGEVRPVADLLLAARPDDESGRASRAMVRPGVYDSSQP